MSLKHTNGLNDCGYVIQDLNRPFRRRLSKQSAVHDGFVCAYRKLLVLLGSSRLLAVACRQDAVPTRLPRRRHLPDRLQLVHGLLHLRHAHLLVPVRLRTDGAAQLVERAAVPDGAQVGRLRRRQRPRVRRGAGQRGRVPAAVVRPRSRRLPGGQSARVAVPRRARPLGLLRRNTVRVQLSALGGLRQVRFNLRRLNLKR